MAGTARQVHLGRKLRDLRKGRGFNLKEAADHLSRSRATVGHWETGLTRVGQSDLVALLDFYGADEDLAARLLELRQESQQRAWWQSYKLPGALAPFVGFEEEAREKFHFELGIVPGLLQTESYARVVARTGKLHLSEEQIDSWVAARLKRQDRLKCDGGLVLHAVVAEEALHRVVGSPAIMGEQLEHIAELAERPNVGFRVVPFGAGAHASMTGPIVVLRFPDGGPDDVAFAEAPLGGHIVDDLQDVAELVRLFAELRDDALPENESLSLLRGVARELAQR